MNWPVISLTQALNLLQILAFENKQIILRRCIFDELMLRDLLCQMFCTSSCLWCIENALATSIVSSTAEVV